MKRSLFTLCAIAGFAAFAHGQGALQIETASDAHSQGFNTATTNPALSNGYISGTVSLELFSIAYSSTALTEAQQINANAALGTAAGNAAAQEELLADFTQQEFGPSAGSEALSQSFSVTGFGEISLANGVVETVGSAGTLTSGSDVLYAILATDGNLSGAYVLDGISGYEAGGGSFAVPTMGADMPNQNILLVTSAPEPCTLALAALGGLSMLGLRRRKA